ncbi:lantibiotic dehydratase family protein [Tenacibaculum sp. TC6]|uniref:lantibiotic dehydratase family protein n=1 Tax=Tenacibaculum sp. TC6 TaxID=3423223 RepID=UPI003D360994
MYKIFDTYILRTPLFPIDFFLNITRDEEVSDNQLKEVFQNPLVKESIYLASPILFEEIKKWTEGKKTDDANKIKISFLKYLSRMSSRPTPFGLFSGCSIGAFDQQNNIERKNVLNNRHTRLDMDLTGIIVKRIENNLALKEQLLFYPNNSLYTIGGVIRFVESTYNSSNKLIHKVVEVETSEYLENSIEFSKEGKTITELANRLVEPEISIDEAKEYIFELIDSQILTSELQQTVSGTENLENIISTLKKLKDVDQILVVLESIKSKITDLDHHVQNEVSLYYDVLALLQQLEINVNPKYVFQTDLVIGNEYNTLSDEFINHIEEGLRVINSISLQKNHSQNTDLNKFKEAFYERYETQEVPLSLVLDKELGLGYPVNTGTGDVNPLIDDLNIQSVSGKSSDQFSLSSFEKMLLNKIIEAKNNKEITIEIKEDEIPEEGNLNDLTDTFSTLAQVVNLEKENYVHLNFFTGSSAGNLIGRFCNGDVKMNEFINEIVEVEKKINSDKILAEIVHLPEDRLGNVLMRPSVRNFEIPYLARSLKNNEHQIPISDLLISIRNNAICLRSKKHNKEVLPRLTTAHYFKSSTLPIYRFLCDLQGENKRTMIRFGWDSLSNFSDFFPRIIYKKIIISTAKWKMNIKDIKHLYDIKNNKILLKEMHKFRTNKSIPKIVYFVEGDNKILLNLQNTSSIQTLFNLVKHKSNFLLEECLFNEHTICTNSEKEHYVNEFIFSFYKNQI